MRGALVPPDKRQCQAEKRMGSFMSFGGVPKLVRCTKRAVWIATEVKKGKDGRRGSMSLCDACAGVMTEQLGKDYATFKPIRRRQ
jgi:hypothetical protein